MSFKQLEQTLLWTVKLGILIIPFLPLFVSSSMLFPFITGKNFAFRIIVEIVFALWAGLAVLSPQYRPRLTPLFKAVTLFIAIVFVADILSANPYRAFFSNYERMEGFMTLFHVYLLFIVLTSVFKTGKDWMLFFHTTLIASIMVSFVAIQQKLGYRVSLQGGTRVDATIGNPAYLASYLLFHIWLLLILMYQYWKIWWRQALYGAIMVLQISIMYFTETRGSMLGFLAGSALFLAALVVFARKISLDSRLRAVAAGALALVILVPGLLWMARDNEYIKSHPRISRFTNISLSEGTAKSRLQIWSMSTKAALERPVFGWGQENYYLVFQKYYHPGLYAQEPWFDRSHNVVLDWLVHAGFLGLAAYLGIFAAVFWTIITGIRRYSLPAWQGIALSALFVSYFFQNLFVFDNLITYFLFFVFLAYAQFLYGVVASPASVVPEKKSPKEAKPAYAYGNKMKAVYVSLGMLSLFTWAGYFLHIKPIYQAKALIAALASFQIQQDLGATKQAFETALAYGTFGTTETREQLANTARTASADSRFSEESRREFLDFAVEEMRKESRKPAKDVKHLLFLGSLLNQGAVTFDSSYVREAETVLQEAVRVSPSKQIIQFELAQLYLATNQTNKALDVLKRTWEADKSYKDAAGNLLAIAILAGNSEISSLVRSEINLSDFPEHILSRLANAYQRADDLPSTLEIYGILVSISPDNASYRGPYAILLANEGNVEEARIQALEAARLNPDLKEEVEQFLEMIGSN